MSNAIIIKKKFNLLLFFGNEKNKMYYADIKYVG